MTTARKRTPMIAVQVIAPAIAVALVAGTISAAATNRGAICYENNGPTQFLDSQRYCVSSVLAPQAGNSYGPYNLFYGPSEAAWCEGVFGNGEGETVTIETDPAVTFSTVVIRNGYQKSKTTFPNNGRVRSLEIEVAGLRDRFTLRDAPGEQRLNLSRTVKTRKILLRIVSVYPGRRNSDTCLSGLWLDLEGG